MSPDLVEIKSLRAALSQAHADAAAYLTSRDRWRARARRAEAELAQERLDQEELEQLTDAREGRIVKLEAEIAFLRSLKVQLDTPHPKRSG